MIIFRPIYLYYCLDFYILGLPNDKNMAIIYQRKKIKEIKGSVIKPEANHSL